MLDTNTLPICPPLGNTKLPIAWLTLPRLPCARAHVGFLNSMHNVTSMRAVSPPPLVSTANLPAPVGQQWCSPSMLYLSRGLGVYLNGFNTS
jgi:hypothetical protein